jgi:hypothetical protein
MRKLSKIGLVFTAFALVISSLIILPASAIQPGSVSGAGSHTFSGRRGVLYHAAWDRESYEMVISTPDGTFPWDWISFVGERGAIALAGHEEVASTFAFSDAHALPGVQAGDILRVKGWDNLSLAHLSKIGIVLGSGSQASRYWLGSGVIEEYYLSPISIGYKVNIEGRSIIVRLYHLLTGPLHVTGVIHVKIDNPSDARLYFVSDLEPSDRYQQAVEYRDNRSTHLSFDTDTQSIQGLGTGSIRAYLYSSSPLLSWSASDLPYNDYLQVDELDALVQSGANDGRAALQVAAEPEQYFYIGNFVLPDDLRLDHNHYRAALNQQRLDALQNLPLLISPEMPGFEFVAFLSNLFLTYLVNPAGNIHYTDKVFPYTADNLMILTEAPEILPSVMVRSYRDYLMKLSDWQYTSPTQGAYWWRAEIDGHPALPDWYAGNIPEIVFRSQHDSLINRYQYSDLFATAEYLMSLAAYYRLTGDTVFIQSYESNLLQALTALENYNIAYQQEFAAQDHFYPHLLVPMGDLYYAEGVYPAESALAIYAFEDALYLLDLLGKEDLAARLQPIVEQMRAEYDDTFWVEEESFYLPRRDQRSSTGSGEYYHDFWAHTIYPILSGDLGKEHLAAILDVYTSSYFLDQDNNFRWLSTNSENYAPDSEFQDGYVMEGGFFNGAPNVAPAIAYYQLGQSQQGNQAAKELYLDVWTRMGPYETMRQWENRPPGLYLETSIYIESLISTLWLIKEAMGIEVDGIKITLTPRISGEFHLVKLNLASQGKRVVLNYGRDNVNCEYMDILSNTGLIIAAPQTGACTPQPSPTPIPWMPTPIPTVTPGEPEEHLLFLGFITK